MLKDCIGCRIARFFVGGTLFVFGVLDYNYYLCSVLDGCRIVGGFVVRKSFKHSEL